MDFGQLMVAHGVREAVLCPGSRNAPINIALARTPGMRTFTAVDERAAAFMALGISLAKGEPAAIVCTSGSALLDAAPAVAEAYYRHVPLVVISADRPAEWIDQDDSQTIRQPRALAEVVRHAVNIPVATPDNQPYISRLLNEALNCATTGPVHINYQIADPSQPLPAEPGYNIIRCLRPKLSILTIGLDDALAACADEASDAAKLLVYVGGINTSFVNEEGLQRSLEILAENSATVCAEFQSGLHSPLFVRSSREVPDVLVSLGGAPVSQRMKNWLRANPPRRHIRLSATDGSTLVDTYGCLTTTVDADPVPFLQFMAHRRRRPSAPAPFEALDPEPLEWSDLQAVGIILASCADIDIHVSNGTLIRCVQHYRLPSGCRAMANRGVSGIDGSTSTAIGSALASGRPTLLLTGDMSFNYDLGALSLPRPPASMRVVVFDNGGGGIFRFARSTASAAEREPLFCAPGGTTPGADAIARLYGWSTCRVGSAAELRAALAEGWLEPDAAAGADAAPRLMVVATDAATSARVFASAMR